MSGPAGRMVAVVLAALAVGGCGQDLPSATAMCADTNALVLIAQAVPDAESIPCFPEMPYGYRTTTFDVESGHAEIALSHAVVGLDAAVLSIGDTCVLDEEEAPVSTPERGHLEQHLERTDSGGIGGWITQGLGDACLVITLDLDHAQGDRALDDLDESWTLLSREDLSATLHAETDGLLGLDPS
ncbi:hypothetical protein [Euzebya rosea]|uniref:hypothetical protein n=1 Tax=Euzebya rosea TaxID=2052804 RepID=UPI000D3E2DF3|nr:hypothetical protein [Euzebya rosea]